MQMEKLKGKSKYIFIGIIIILVAIITVLIINKKSDRLSLFYFSFKT